MKLYEQLTSKERADIAMTLLNDRQIKCEEDGNGNYRLHICPFDGKSYVVQTPLQLYLFFIRTRGEEELEDAYNISVFKEFGMVGIDSLKEGDRFKYPAPGYGEMTFVKTDETHCFRSGEGNFMRKHYLCRNVELAGMDMYVRVGSLVIPLKE